MDNSIGYTPNHAFRRTQKAAPLKATMARTLRAAPPALRIAIRFLSWR